MLDCQCNHASPGTFDTQKRAYRFLCFLHQMDPTHVCSPNLSSWATLNRSLGLSGVGISLVALRHAEKIIQFVLLLITWPRLASQCRGLISESAAVILKLQVWCGQQQLCFTSFFNQSLRPRLVSSCCQRCAIHSY